MAEYDDLDQMYEDPEVSPYDNSDVLSPLQALMGGMYGTVTPEGKAEATRVYQDLYNKRSSYDDEEQAAYDDYEARANEARDVLRKARDVLAAKKTPSTRWLEMAAGFGAPTRAGSFGESLSNYAQARIPGKQREAAWEQARDQQVLGYDQGMGNLDQALALQRLQMRARRQAANDKLMVEAMKLMGKPTPMTSARLQTQTPAAVAEKELNKAYIKDYVEFMQTGASNASADIAALEAAQNSLQGIKTDPKTGELIQGKKPDNLSGPFLGIWPKAVRDIFAPKSSETQENVESVAQKSMRVIMGPQFTEGEGTRLLARVWNPRFEEGVNAKRVGRLLRQLQLAYNEKVRAARYFEDNGTLKGYKGRKVWTMSMFDPDVPEGKSPLDAMINEAESLLPGNSAPEPDEGQDIIDIEELMPAQERAQGGQVRKYAEGGVVMGADGRPVYTMPDGHKVRGKAGMSYDQVLQIYTTRTGRAPTRPGLPPQEIPARTDVPDESAMTGPVQRPRVMPPQPEDTDDSLTMDVAGGAGRAALGAGATMGATAVADRLPGRRITSPEKRVIDMMQERRTSPEALVANVRNLQRQGIPAMAMDAGDEGVRALADSALSESGGPNATEALARLRARAAGQLDRTQDQINSALKPDPYFDQLDKLKDNLYTNAKPMYEAAYKAHPAVKSKVLGEILSTPDGKAAVKNALRIMRNEGKKIGAADVTGMVSSPSLEFLDNVKRGLDQQIQKEEGHGINYQATPLGKSMRDLRTRLLNELDSATTTKGGKSLYADARAQYGGDLEVLDALQTGRADYLKLTGEEASRLTQNMSFAEKDALRTGVAQALFERIDKPEQETNSARKVIGSPAMRKRLRPLFDTDKQYELFETALQKDMEIHDASQRSITAGEQGLAQHYAPKPGMLRRVVSKVPRLGITSKTMWALQFIRNATAKDEPKIDEVLKHLKAATPEELADLEKFQSKFNRRVGRKGRMGKVAAVGAALGAGSKVYSELTEDDDGADFE